MQTRGRGARLARLRQLVARGGAHSQEELLGLLHREGFAVTQATLSRDLKYLRVGKLPDGQGGYRYGLAETGAPASEAGLIEDFRRGFMSIEFSGNQGVIKTLPGHASSVAFALDNLRRAGGAGHHRRGRHDPGHSAGRGGAPRWSQRFGPASRACGRTGE